MKQLYSPMAMVVSVSLPSSLHPPSPSLRLRPPPDPPPCSSFLVPFEALCPPEPPDPPPCSSFLVPFEALSPPEPPDPPDASFCLIIHLLFDTPFTLSQTISKILNLESPFSYLVRGGVVSLVFIGDTRFGSNGLHHAVCSLIFGQRIVWSCHSSSPIHVGSLSVPFMMVCVLSSISFGSLVEWSERFVGCVAQNMPFMSLDYNVPVNFVSFGSTLMPVDVSYVALVRPFTAVCSLFSVFNPAFGAVILWYPSWWQIEGKLVVMLISLNQIMAGFHYPMASFEEQFPFPIVPLMLSELDGQASSSWLMRSSVFVAVFVTFQVTRCAVIQDDYEIFGFFMVSCYDVYRQSIFYLIFVWFVQPLVVLMYLCGVEHF